MGPLASHMVLHIVLMNLLAPLAAFGISRVSDAWRSPAAGSLTLATVAQLAALWVWHAPPLLNQALQSHAIHLLMQGTLFLGAFCFWSAIFAVDGNRRWKPIIALLLTSKLFCLLAVLFVFSPRALYPAAAGIHGHSDAVLQSTLADQQLAGVVMLVACPATYVLAGIVIAGRWIFAIERQGIDAGAEALKAGARKWT